METYYQRNKKKILAYGKQYYIDHHDELIAKQRVYNSKRKEHQAEYYREWYKENGRNRADNYIEKILEWTDAFPERVRIQRLLRYAIKIGKVIRPEICPKCGRKAKIQAHHVNYEHFMNFVFLCASCHKKEHNYKKRLDGTAPEVYY